MRCGWLLVTGCLLLAAGCGPKIREVALPDLRASQDEELLARGEYLFHGPSHCTACHLPVEEAAEVRGGDRPSPIGGHVWKMGPAATLRAPNLTSDVETGMGGRSDGELARTLRHGVLPDGTLSLLMTVGVGRLADDDIEALLSYMRTLEPRSNPVKPSEVGFIGNLVFNRFSPKEAGPARAPPVGVTVERGKYLAEAVANCVGCHSTVDLGSGKLKPGLEFAGGERPMNGMFPDDPNRYMASNLTTDEETGIAGRWTEEQFLARFQLGRLERGSAMPWGNYQNMHPEDLRAIWAYLKTVPPVKRDTGEPVRRK